MYFKYILWTYIIKENRTDEGNMFFKRRDTKNEGVQAFVGHVVISQHLFFLLNATTKILTRFLCWSFAIKTTSFLNSSFPCLELFDRLFTTICCPSDNWPWIHDPKLSILITINFKKLILMPLSATLVTHLSLWNSFSTIHTCTIMEYEVERKMKVQIVYKTPLNV